MPRVLSTVVGLWIGVACSMPAQAQEFGGSYVILADDGLITLELSQDASGMIAGRLNDHGRIYRLDGGPEAPGISGWLVSDLNGARFGFVAELQDQDRKLWFRAFPFDDRGGPDNEHSVTLMFARQTTAATVNPAPPDTRSAETDRGQRNVWVNRVGLPDQTIQQFETLYATPLPDGRYWYDGLSGAWGLEGGPTAGFMFPGLDLPGPMPVDISGGGTGIFINGREIHLQDQIALHQLFGVTYAGRYWLDGQGNFGVEGGPFIGNLLQLTQARGGQGGVTGTADGVGGMSGVTGDGGAVFMKRLPSGKMLNWSN